MYHERPRGIPGPHSFDELLTSAKSQLHLTVLTLQDRAEHLQRFLDDFENSDGSPEAINGLARTYYVHLHDDHLVPAIVEIIHNWPHVATQPGEGYW